MATKTQHIVIWSLSIVFGLLLLITTFPHGAGVSADSVFYLGTAERILEGRGFTMPFDVSGRRDVVPDVPVLHWPPLFPMTVAATKWLTGLQITQAAAVLNAAAFAISLILLARLVYLVTSHFVISICTLLAFASAPKVITVYSMAWSEPLFIVFTFFAFLILNIFLKTGYTRYLVLSAAFIALSTMTRNVGVIIYITCLLGILLLRSGTLLQRFKIISLFSAISLLPYAIWLLHNLLITGTMVGRELDFHPLRLGDIYTLLQLLSQCVFPSIIWNLSLLGKKVVIIIATLVVFIIILHQQLYVIHTVGFSQYIHKSRSALNKNATKILLLFYGLNHIAFVYMTKMLYDSKLNIDFRMFLPAIYIFFIIFSVVISSIIKNTKSNLLRVFFVSYAIAYLVTASAGAYSVYDVLKERGYLGHFSFGWTRDLQITAQIRNVPDSLIVYSNLAVPLTHGSGRVLYQLPQYPPDTPVSVPRVENDYETMVYDDFKNHKALLVWSANGLWFSESTPHAPDSLIALYNLTLDTTLQDGAIYSPRK